MVDDRLAIALLAVALLFWFGGYMHGRIRAAGLFVQEIWRLREQLELKREAHRTTWRQLEQAQLELAELKGVQANG